MRTMDESFLLPQSLSAGQAQSTFNGPAPQGFGHREKATSGLLHSVRQNRVLFLSECPVGCSYYGRRLEEGVQTGFLTATRELGGTGTGTDALVKEQLRLAAAWCFSWLWSRQR